MSSSRGSAPASADQSMLYRPGSHPHRSPSTGMISLLYQLSIVIPGGAQQDPATLSREQRGSPLDFPLATLLQIEHEFLRRSLDQINVDSMSGLSSNAQRLVYEALRRTGLVLVSAAVDAFQQTPGSHSNLDHSVMSLFMLDVSAILNYSPSFAVFVLCTTGPFTSEAVRGNVRRWLAAAAARTNLLSWPDVRSLLINQFFYYPSLLDPVCPLLWHECEPLLMRTIANMYGRPQAMLVDSHAVTVDPNAVLVDPQAMQIDHEGDGSDDQTTPTRTRTWTRPR